MRKDLPNDFPFQVLDVGYAVVEVRCRSLPSDGLSIDSIEFRNQKGKQLKVAESSEIAPKLMKYYRTGSLGIHGAARPVRGYNRHPGAARADRGQPTIGNPSTVGTVDAGTGPALRELLESFRFRAGYYEQGSKPSGFVYVQSKKSGRNLSGGRVLFAGHDVLIP